MLSRPHLRGALDALFAELEETATWEREIADEARRAASRRERLAQSLRCTIGTLEPPERAPELCRLRAALGQPESKPIACRTERIRLILDWLSRRDPPEFAVSELRAHLLAHGHAFGRGYLPALMDRWTREGVVTRLGHGRYRVNGDRVETPAHLPS